MGYKSRGGWSIPVCLKDCRNRDIDCEECFGFSKFKANSSQKLDMGFSDLIEKNDKASR